MQKKKKQESPIANKQTFPHTKIKMNEQHHHQGRRRRQQQDRKMGLFDAIYLRLTSRGCTPPGHFWEPGRLC